MIASGALTVGLTALHAATLLYVFLLHALFPHLIDIGG
jgi:hypothetical protein